MIVTRYWITAPEPPVPSIPFIEHIEWRDPPVKGFGIQITIPSNAYIDDTDKVVDCNDIIWVSVVQPAFPDDQGKEGDLYTLPLSPGVTIVTMEEWQVYADAYKQYIADAEAERARQIQEQAQARADALQKLGDATGLTQEEVNALVGGA